MLLNCKRCNTTDRLRKINFNFNVLLSAKPNRHASAYISGCGGSFELSCFALKPCAVACSFA